MLTLQQPVRVFPLISRDRLFPKMVILLLLRGKIVDIVDLTDRAAALDANSLGRNRRNSSTLEDPGQLAVFP